MNEVGLQEFLVWFDKVGSELMFVINFGIWGVQEVFDLFEYLNLVMGMVLVEWCVEYGYFELYVVLMWCFGNEMDGLWQLGYCLVDDYGKFVVQIVYVM